MGGVLIVEDDEDIRSDLTAILRHKGFAVRGAANGREALAELQQGLLPCLILLDLMMPVMNGWELRQVLLGEPRWAEIPVVVVSGAGPADERTAELGDGFLLKPFELRQLLDVVARYCQTDAPQTS